MVGRCRGMVGGRIIVSLSFIRHISHIAVVVVGMVADMLGPAIGQHHRVGALHVTRGVRRLPSVEVSSGVVVMDPVLVAVGLGLLLLIGRGRVGRGRVVAVAMLAGGKAH